MCAAMRSQGATPKSASSVQQREHKSIACKRRERRNSGVGVSRQLLQCPIEIKRCWQRGKGSKEPFSNQKKQKKDEEERLLILLMSLLQQPRLCTCGTRSGSCSSRRKLSKRRVEKKMSLSRHEEKENKERNETLKNAVFFFASPLRRRQPKASRRWLRKAAIIYVNLKFSQKLNK